VITIVLIQTEMIMANPKKTTKQQHKGYNELQWLYCAVELWKLLFFSNYVFSTDIISLYPYFLPVLLKMIAIFYKLNIFSLHI
jgi:membrane-associated HD superfamily phosphohydrolase